MAHMTQGLQLQRYIQPRTFVKLSSHYPESSIYPLWNFVSYPEQTPKEQAKAPRYTPSSSSGAIIELSNLKGLRRRSIMFQSFWILLYSFGVGYRPLYHINPNDNTPSAPSTGLCKLPGEPRLERAADSNRAAALRLRLKLSAHTLGKRGPSILYMYVCIYKYTYRYTYAYNVYVCMYL